MLGLPDVPLTWETLRLILPFSVGIAFVGLLESLLTAKLVDDITDTRSDKTRESWGRVSRTWSRGCSAAWAAAPWWGRP